MRLRMKVYGFLLLIGVFVGGYFVYGHFKSSRTPAHANSAAADKKTSGKEDTAVPVEVADATSGDISAYVSTSTNLRALREVEIAGQTEGRIKEVLAEEGDFVKSGQPLCLLDDTELQMRLLSAQQRLAQARLQMEKARVRREKAAIQIRSATEDLQRYRKLFDERLVSQRDVALLEYKVEELEHDERVSSSETRELSHRVEELEAEIDQARLEISKTRVVAPFNGYITRRFITVGQTVRNLESLFRLSDFTPLQADVFLSEAEAVQVHPNQPVRVYLNADAVSEMTGKVLRISPVVDQATGTVKITVELDQQRGSFKPGAFVRVDIQTDTRRNAVLIPKRAILEEDGAKYIYVLDGEKAVRTTVKLGFQRNEQVEILEGVSDGSRVVVAGQGALKKESKVRIVKG
jgi:membrane fusion protein, multidrug efflux system